MANHLAKLKTMVNGRYTRVAAFAVIGVVVGGVIVALSFLATGYDYQNQNVPTPTSTIEAISGPVYDKAEPVRLRVPSVGIDASFEGPLGLNADQSIEVPDTYDELGWYRYGPTPGDLGPAVVLGHVDSIDGPAVFFALGQTEVGDIVEIDRADGTTVRFEITRLDRRPQSDFPTREVYGDIDHAGLRLITCSGVYNHGTLEYSHNLIVYAKLVDSEVNDTTSDVVQ